MLVLPQIDALERALDHLNLRFVIPDTNPYFQGHFPGCPVLPGVVQVGWAIQFARLHIPYSARFRALVAVKFMRVIQPDTALALRLAVHPQRRELSFEYQFSGAPCSSGRVQFD